MSLNQEKDDYLIMLRDNPNKPDVIKGAHIGRELISEGYAMDASSKDGFYCFINDNGKAFINSGGFMKIEKFEEKKEDTKSKKKVLIQIAIALISALILYTVSGMHDWLISLFKL